jgi:glycosyltransferase involved in cell wall biosynthesis
MARRPKIALVGGDGGRSGVPRHIEQLAEVLGPWADLTIISDLDRGGFGFAKEFRHIEIPGLATGLNPLRAYRAKAALSGALREIRPDLVWAHARMALPLSRSAMRGGGLGRLMVTYHGMPFGPGHGALRSAVSIGLEIAGLRAGPQQDLVFLTEEDRAGMPDWLVGDTRCHILPNSSVLGGADMPQPVRTGSRRLVMLTRDSRQKNLDHAARLFAILPGDFRLDLHGMGTDSAELKRRFAAVLGAKSLERVQFVGPTEDVRSVLAGADGLLVTSRYEGLSIAMIEAMEMGVPVFSTKVGGTEMIGRLHPLFGLITADLAQSAAMIDEMTAQFRSAPMDFTAQIRAVWAQHFGPERWASKVNGLVRQILEGGP